MVKLFCAVVGAAGSAFSVRVDESDSVDDLKTAIKVKKPLKITCDADELQLYLAKKGDEQWLTENEVKSVSDTSGLKHLDAVRARLRRVGLSEEDMIEVDEDEEAAGNGPVNMLVVVPPEDVVVFLSVLVAVPTGPEVDLHSCDHLVAFLEAEMTNKEAIVSRPHILAQESLEFRLVGREQAIDTASKCFKNIVTHARSTASDRIQVAMPICSGISGLGKTRMLEEGGTILERMKLDPDHVSPISRAIDANRGVFLVAALVSFFRDMNCDLSFPKWFKSRLPPNGAQLTLECAVQVIDRKLLDKLQEPATLYLSLGVDEYQKIEKIGARQRDPNTSLLRELVETIGALLCLKSSSLVLLPMFAGTDLGVIASGSIANSSYYVTKRLPMNLLSMDQVFSIVESNASYARLLSHAQICRDLFVLGGVPRWVVEYLKSVEKTCVQGEPVKLDNINKCFVEIWSAYVQYYLDSLETPQLVRLAAFAVSGQTVDLNGTFDGNLKWSKLRDSSLCLLIPRISSKSGEHDVRVPYALLVNIGSRREELVTDAERNFASALNDMRDEVDSTMFKLQPWQSWEMFGACFYAVRINALLALGHSTVTLRNLLPGTLMSGKTSAITAILVPSKVIRCAGAFGASTPPLIPRKGKRLETIDWLHCSE